MRLRAPLAAALAFTIVVSVPETAAAQPAACDRACLGDVLTRYLALVCIVSVMLGVATLIVVNSVMSGFSTKLKDRLHGVLGYLQYAREFPDASNVLDILEHVSTTFAYPGVEESLKDADKITPDGANMALVLNFYDPPPCVTGYNTPYREGGDTSYLPFDTTSACTLPSWIARSTLLTALNPRKSLVNPVAASSVVVPDPVSTPGWAALTKPFRQRCREPGFSGGAARRSPSYSHWRRLRYINLTSDSGFV